MNLNQLKIFYAVAKENSFSLAAKNLFITQPAVTIQIHLLEDYFGVKLVQRDGRKIRLTEAGKALYSYAEKIIKMFGETENVMADFKSLDQGLLRIDTTRTIAKYYIPKILTLFIEKHPNININLRAGNSQEALDGVLDFTCDIAIVGRINYPAKLSVIPFFEEQLVVIASPDSGLFEEEQAEIGELHGKPFIMREEGSGTRKLLLELFEKEGISPNIVMEVGNCDTIKELVNKGIGLSILTWKMVEDDVRRGFLRAIHLCDEELFIKVESSSLDRIHRMHTRNGRFLKRRIEI
jgi:DNA-binding transcriptional LysR family regulator